MKDINIRVYYSEKRELLAAAETDKRGYVIRVQTYDRIRTAGDIGTAVKDFVMGGKHVPD